MSAIPRPAGGPLCLSTLAKLLEEHTSYRLKLSGDGLWLVPRRLARRRVDRLKPEDKALCVFYGTLVVREIPGDVVTKEAA